MRVQCYRTAEQQLCVEIKCQQSSVYNVTESCYVLKLGFFSTDYSAGCMVYSRSYRDLAEFDNMVRKSTPGARKTYTSYIFFIYMM